MTAGVRTRDWTAFILDSPIPLKRARQQAGLLIWVHAPELNTHSVCATMLADGNAENMVSGNEAILPAAGAGVRYVRHSHSGV